MHNGWLGKAADDPLVFISLYNYLISPPARKVLLPDVDSDANWGTEG
jgi:hypothetical protein